MRRGGVAAIDFGTTKVTALTGGYDEQGRLRITGTGIASSHGVVRGMVDDIAKATASITAAVRAAEQAAGYTIESATIAISGSHIASINSRGTVALPNLHHAITPDDVRRAIEGARAVPIPNNREIIQAIPRFYIVDGEESSGDPIGRYGHRLDVEAHIVTASVTAIQNLNRCLDEAGVRIDGLVLGAAAAADAVLDEDERMHGVVLVDIGGGVTDVAVFVEGSVLHSAVLPVGGNHITNDLVYGLRVPFRSADEIKEVYGQCIPAAVAPDETVEIEAFGRERRRTINRRRAAEIIEARVEEMFEFVRDEVAKAGYEEMISAGVVVTGGTANLAGLIDVAERVLQMPGRIGAPGGVYNLHERLENPAFAASIGVLGWAVREHDAVLKPARARRPTTGPRGGLWSKVTGMAKLMLPMRYEPSTRGRGDADG